MTGCFFHFRNSYSGDRKSRHFDINDYLIVNQISELDLSASAKTVGGAFAVAAVWAVVSLIAVYGVFKRRDI